MLHRSICKLIPALALAYAVLANAGESELAADTTAHAAAGAKNSATSPAADTAKTDSAKAVYTEMLIADTVILEATLVASSQ